MINSFIWQQNSSDANNGENFDAIAQWWFNLKGKEVAWQQRLLPSEGNQKNLDWQPQKFDEKFVIQDPQLRGITVFWRNGQGTDERNITPSKLQLDLAQQKLLIFPQSQSQVVIRVSLPSVVYQKLNLVNPQIAATIKNGQGTILLRDEGEKMEVKVTLDQEKLTQLLNKLKTIDNQ